MNSIDENEFNENQISSDQELNDKIEESNSAYDSVLKKNTLASNHASTEKDNLNEYDDENVVLDDNSVNSPIWEYRSGYAFEETQHEYEYLRFYLQLGRARSKIHLARIFNSSTNYINKIADKNNWYERVEAYDRQTYVNALSQENKTRRELHEEKLEIFRAQQETLANQASGNAAKILHLIQRKLDKLMNDTDNLTLDELVSTGNLAVKFSQLQKELGSQALAVDALLEAIDGEDG